MEEEIRREILFDLSETIKILEEREPKDVEELKRLSEHAIEDVALYKNTDLVAVTVLIYSIYKILPDISLANQRKLVKDLLAAHRNLQEGKLGRYNRNIKTLYNAVRQSNAKVRQHLQDVMQAARIKKGTSLLQRGLSIGQAAGLMGLSNWDLQAYASKLYLDHTEAKIPAKKRLMGALKIFGVN